MCRSLSGRVRKAVKRKGWCAAAFVLAIAAGDSKVRGIDRRDPDFQNSTGGSPMKLAALLIGFFMMSVGFVGLVVPSPGDIRAFLGEFTVTPAGLYVLAALRIGIGLVFIRAAPMSRTPGVLRTVGTIMVVLGVVTAFRDVQSGRAVIKWELSLGTPFIRAAAAFWLAFGAFVTFTFSKRRTV
jgi:hypothetical protein